jgi:uncharacterized linocin/CFP29 family protein
MNNLHRELAPISDAAWAQIEDETKRTLKRYLAGRRVVDVEGPSGAGLSAIGTGHLRRIDGPSEGVLARQREVKPLVELRANLTAGRSTTPSAARMTRTGSPRRTQRRRSPMPRTAPSSRAMGPLRSEASGRGRAIRS